MKWFSDIYLIFFLFHLMFCFFLFFSPFSGQSKTFVGLEDPLLVDFVYFTTKYLQLKI